MTDQRIPVFLPYLGPEVREAITRALDAGWVSIGSLTYRFEEELARYAELDEERHLLSLSSGTAALHTAAILAGLGPGDEVICPSFTYVACHQAISATGADVVFCDVEEETSESIQRRRPSSFRTARRRSCPCTTRESPARSTRSTTWHEPTACG